MQSNGSTDAVTPLGTPNLTQMDDGDAIRHEMAPRARGGGAPPWYGFKLLLASSQGLATGTTNDWWPRHHPYP